MSFGSECLVPRRILRSHRDEAQKPPGLKQDRSFIESWQNDASLLLLLVHLQLGTNQTISRQLLVQARVRRTTASKHSRRFCRGLSLHRGRFNKQVWSFFFKGKTLIIDGNTFLLNLLTFMFVAQTKTSWGNRLRSAVDIIVFTGRLKHLCDCLEVKSQVAHWKNEQIGGLYITYPPPQTPSRKIKIHWGDASRVVIFLDYCLNRINGKLFHTTSKFTKLTSLMYRVQILLLKPNSKTIEKKTMGETPWFLRC